MHSESIFTIMRAAKVVTEIRQEQIAKMALDLVAVHGIKGLTTERIAAAVGVVPSALYKHFKGKKQIFKAIVRLIIQQSEHISREIDNGGEDFLQRLYHVYMAEITRAISSPGIPFIVFSDEMLNSDSEIKSLFCKAHENRFAAIIKLYQAAQDAGQIRNDMSAEALTIHQFGMVAQIGFLMLHQRGEEQILKHAEISWKVFSEMLKVS